MTALLRRGWFYLALAATFAAGLLMPEIGAWMARWKLSTALMVLAFLLNGLTLSTTALLGNLRRWPIFAVALGLIFIAVPLIVLGARQLLPGGHSELAIGFQMLAVVPTTLVSAVVLTRVAHGNGAAALYITVLANLTAVVVVPLLMRATLGAAGADLDVVGISASLALTVVLPTLVGQAIRRGWRDPVVRHARTLGFISQLTILFFLISGLSALPRSGLSLGLWGTVFAFGLLFHLVLLAVGTAAGRLLALDGPTRIALTLAIGQKSLIIAVYLFDRILAPLGPAYGIAILPAIAHYIIALVADGVLAQQWARGRIEG